MSFILSISPSGPRNLDKIDSSKSNSSSSLVCRLLMVDKIFDAGTLPHTILGGVCLRDLFFDEVHCKHIISGNPIPRITMFGSGYDIRQKLSGYIRQDTGYKYLNVLLNQNIISKPH